MAANQPSSTDGAAGTGRARGARLPHGRGLLVIAFGLLDIWWALTSVFSHVAWGAAENMGILCIGLAGSVGGAGTIMGRNWARWLVAAWIALHVALSATDPPMLAAHAAIFIVVVVGLCNPAASRYFRIL